LSAFVNGAVLTFSAAHAAHPLRGDCHVQLWTDVCCSPREFVTQCSAVLGSALPAGMPVFSLHKPLTNKSLSLSSETSFSSASTATSPFHSPNLLSAGASPLFFNFPTIDLSASAAGAAAAAGAGAPPPPPPQELSSFSTSAYLGAPLPTRISSDPTGTRLLDVSTTLRSARSESLMHGIDDETVNFAMFEFAAMRLLDEPTDAPPKHTNIWRAPDLYHHQQYPPQQPAFAPALPTFHPLQQPSAPAPQQQLQQRQQVQQPQQQQHQQQQQQQRQSLAQQELSDDEDDQVDESGDPVKTKRRRPGKRQRERRKAARAAAAAAAAAVTAESTTM
jgi:hypothetical protein